MTGVVLDSSAVLAVIHGERGAEVVASLLDGAMMSAVNYAEVVSKLVERGTAWEFASANVLKLDIAVVAFDLDLANRTGELRRQTRHLGLSLADRACLALAERERLPALTADRNWSSVNIGIDVRLIR
jgi:PIN domain nuclease of toxin-antitoxin system